VLVVVLLLLRGVGAHVLLALTPFFLLVVRPVVLVLQGVVVNLFVQIIILPLPLLLVLVLVLVLVMVLVLLLLVFRCSRRG